MKKYSVAAAMAVALSLSSSAAFSQTATGNMAVTMTVAAECTLTADAIAFPAQGLIATAVNVPGNVTVQCTRGTPYQISMNAGLGVGADTTTRLLTNTADATQLASYSIHQNAADGTNWGNTAGTDTVDSDAATGAEEIHPYVAVLAAGQSVAAGTYTDTVTATITYGAL